jgi:hypothetical protein
MEPDVIAEKTLHSLLHWFAFGPLLLLVGLFFIRGATLRWLVASFIFLLPGLLVVGLWAVTSGETNPRLGDVGLGLMILSAIWVVSAGVLSLGCGALCLWSYLGRTKTPKPDQ